MDFSVIILLSLFCVCFVDAFDFQGSARCLYYNKKCVDHCPRLMHPYHTRCDGQTMSQRTCTDPKIYVLGYTCGWSRCDCNNHLVLDEAIGFCVEELDCSQPGSKRQTRQRGPRKKNAWRLPKRINVHNYEDPREKFMRHP